MAKRRTTGKKSTRSKPGSKTKEQKALQQPATGSRPSSLEIQKFDTLITSPTLPAVQQTQTESVETAKAPPTAAAIVTEVEVRPAQVSGQTESTVPSQPASDEKK